MKNHFETFVRANFRFAECIPDVPNTKDNI